MITLQVVRTSFRFHLRETSFPPWVTSVIALQVVRTSFLFHLRETSFPPWVTSFTNLLTAEELEDMSDVEVETGKWL